MAAMRKKCGQVRREMALPRPLLIVYLTETNRRHFAPNLACFATGLHDFGLLFRKSAKSHETIHNLSDWLAPPSGFSCRGKDNIGRIPHHYFFDVDISFDIYVVAHLGAMSADHEGGHYRLHHQDVTGKYPHGDIWPKASLTVFCARGAKAVQGLLG